MTTSTSTAPLAVSWRRRWLSRRRAVGLVVVAPLTWWGLSSAGGGLAAGPETGWVIAVAVTAALAATTLVSYIPADGIRPDLGCGRCATMAAFSVVIAAGILSTGPGQAGTASIAGLVAGFGLLQRLRDPGTCTGPAAP